MGTNNHPEAVEVIGVPVRALPVRSSFSQAKASGEVDKGAAHVATSRAQTLARELGERLAVFSG